MSEVAVEMDVKRINAAVKIHLQIVRNLKKITKLQSDLGRLKMGMVGGEYNEYIKRIQ